MKNIIYEYDNKVNEIAYKLLKNINYDNLIQKYKINGHVCKIHRGKANVDYTFSIPIFAFNKGIEYFTYYIAHELSHILQYIFHNRMNHRSTFYKYFVMVCPEEFQKYEINYKPRLFNKYGIKKYNIDKLNTIIKNNRENALQIKKFLKNNNIICNVKYIDKGSLKGTYRLYKNMEVNPYIIQKLNDLGFVNISDKKIDIYNFNGGIFSIFVKKGINYQNQD